MSFEKIPEVVTKEGYIVAPVFLRVTAAIIDFFISFLLTIFCYIISFQVIAPKTSYYENLYSMYDEEVSAGFMSLNKGKYEQLSSSNWEDYFEACKTYYLVYDLDTSKTYQYNVQYVFNPKVLGLPTNSSEVNKSEFFEFAKTDGVSDLSKIGVLKASLLDTEGKLNEETNNALLNYMQTKASEAYSELMNKENMSSFYAKLVKISTYLLLVSLLVPAVVCYVLTPLGNRDGATLGKLYTKLKLYNLSGGDLPKYKVALRGLPYLATLTAVVLLNDIVSSGSIGLIIFFISLSLGLLTRRRQALHDYVVLSVVGRREKQNERN